MKNEIESKVRELRKNSVCQSCGGNHYQGKCEYCGKENQEIVDLSNQLEQILANLPPDFFQKGTLNESLTWLYCINDLGIPEVNKLLKDLNYEETLLKSKELVLYAIKEFSYRLSLNQDAINIMAILWENKKLSPSDDLYMTNYLMVNILSQDSKLDISQELKEKVYLHLLESSSDRILDRKTKAKILEDSGFKDRDCKGLNVHGDTAISREALKNPYEALAIVFHETIHTLQQKEARVEKKQSRNLFLKIQDTILSELVPTYYSENYQLIAYEREAFFNQYREALNYCTSLGIEVPQEFKTKMQAYEQRFNVLPRQRTFNGEVLDIDTIFDQKIQSHKEILEKYPQLTFRYKIEDDIVLPKTKEEMEEDYQNYQLGILKWNGPQEEIHAMYQERIALLSSQAEMNTTRGTK